MASEAGRDHVPRRVARHPCRGRPGFPVPGVPAHALVRVRGRLRQRSERGILVRLLPARSRPHTSTGEHRRGCLPPATSAQASVLRQERVALPRAHPAAVDPEHPARSCPRGWCAQAPERLHHLPSVAGERSRGSVTVWREGRLRAARCPTGPEVPSGREGGAPSTRTSRSSSLKDSADHLEAPGAPPARTWRGSRGPLPSGHPCPRVRAEVRRPPTQPLVHREPHVEGDPEARARRPASRRSPSETGPSWRAHPLERAATRAEWKRHVAPVGGEVCAVAAVPASPAQEREPAGREAQGAGVCDASPSRRCAAGAGGRAGPRAP